MVRRNKIKHFTRSEIKKPSLSLLDHQNKIVDRVNRNSNLKINGNVTSTYNRKGSSYYIKKTSDTGSAIRIAYVKEDAPDTNQIICYLDADILDWDEDKTYKINNWVEVAGNVYRSLQNDNLNYVVSNSDWWAILSDWDDATTYELDDWVEYDGAEYKSLQDDNLDNDVSDGEWWEEGSLSVTVKCLIINGSSLMYAAPFLHDGDPIIIGKIIVDGISTWYCTNIEFNGARFSS